MKGEEMPTQEERLTSLEQDFAIFRREIATHTRELEENSTMLLGLAYAQRQDTKIILARLDEQSALLTQILTRLNEPR